MGIRPESLEIQYRTFVVQDSATQPSRVAHCTFCMDHPRGLDVARDQVTTDNAQNEKNGGQASKEMMSAEESIQSGTPAEDGSVMIRKPTKAVASINSRTSPRSDPTVLLWLVITSHLSLRRLNASAEARTLADTRWSRRGSQRSAL